MAMNFNNVSFNDREFFRTDAPMPVTAIRPWKKRDSEEILGTLVTVVIPGRNFATLTVKVAGSKAHEKTSSGVSFSAKFTGLSVRPYAMKGVNGELVSGWTATADSVELSEGVDFL